MKKSAVIFNGTQPKGLALFVLKNRQYDFVIAADGGYNFSVKNNIKVDCLVGDFDSCDKDSIVDDVKTIAYPTEKDATDGELVADYLIECGFEEVDIFGGGGGRVDHFLGNLNALYRLLKSNIAVKMINNKEVIYMVNDTLVLPPEVVGCTLSLIPFTDNATVSIQGVKYPLVDQMLKKDSTLGISNIANGQVVITVKDGYVLAIVNSLKHLVTQLVN